MANTDEDHFIWQLQQQNRRSSWCNQRKKLFKEPEYLVYSRWIGSLTKNNILLHIDGVLEKKTFNSQNEVRSENKF